MHFSISTMAAVVVPWPPWCDPACAEANNNQPRPSAVSTDTMVRGVRPATFGSKLIEVDSISGTKKNIWYKSYVGIIQSGTSFLHEQFIPHL